MLGWIWAAIIGLIVGALAKQIMPGRDLGGIFVTMLIGIAGALVATFLGRQLRPYAAGQTAGFIGSLIGAIILLVLWRLINRSRGTMLLGSSERLMAGQAGTSPPRRPADKSRSDHGSTAVDDKTLPRRERARRTGEQYCHAGDLVGGADPA